MTIKHLLIAAFGLFFFCSFSIMDSRMCYIYIEGLKPDAYKSIKTASLERDDVFIESACIPAGILKFKFSGDLDNAESRLKSFLNETEEFQKVEFLENFTEENYFEKCSDARVGR